MNTLPLRMAGDVRPAQARLVMLGADAVHAASIPRDEIEGDEVLRGPRDRGA